MRWIVTRGLVGSVLLTVAGFMLSPVPAGSWVTHVRPIMSVRHLQHHLVLSLLLSAAGLVLLTWAWWDLRVPARDPASGVSSVRSALLLWTAPLLVAPPLFSGDAWSYVATGYMTGHGQSPYSTTPDALPDEWRSAIYRRWLHTFSPYGPVPHAFGGVLSHVLHTPWLMMLAYRGLALLGLGLLVWATPRLARRCDRDPGTASWLVLASPFMLANAVGGMHLDILVVGLGATALVLVRPGRWKAAALLVGLATAVKVTGGFFAIGVVLLSLTAGATYLDRARRTAQVAAVSVGTVVGAGLLSGLGMGWISALTGQGQMSGRLSASHDLGWLLARAVHLTRLDRSLGNLHVVTRTEYACLALLALGAALLVARHRIGSDPRSLRTTAILMLAVTVLLPVVHYWYFLTCLPLLACVPLERRWRWTLGGCVVALGLSSLADGALHIGALPPATTVLILGGSAAGYLVGRARTPELVSGTSA